jgi:lipopolysaccharide biosynthesis regulator YciM
VLEELV